MESEWRRYDGNGSVVRLSIFLKKSRNLYITVVLSVTIILFIETGERLRRDIVIIEIVRRRISLIGSSLSERVTRDCYSNVRVRIYR